MAKLVVQKGAREIDMMSAKFPTPKDRKRLLRSFYDLPAWEAKSTIDILRLVTSADDQTRSLRLMRNPIVSLIVANVSDVDEPFQ
jgi:hypothetical protein